MGGLQVLRHQCDPVPAVEVAHVDALHARLQHVELEVDPVHRQVLGAVDRVRQHGSDVAAVEVGRVHLRGTQEEERLDETRFWIS